MSKQWNESTATAKGLYDPRYEHDNCGIGAVVNIKGIKTHETVENALKIVENLKHSSARNVTEVSAPMTSPSTSMTGA